MDVDAHEIAKTHYCKFPNCGNEVPSPVGRYSYCEEHRGKAAARNGRGRSKGLAAEIAELTKLARRCDSLDEKARRLTETALVAKEQADKERAELRERMRLISGHA